MARHVPVKGRQGIYYSTRVDGTKVYEVRFRDLTGKQHFKVVGPDLKEALLEQSKINVKIGRGERAHYAAMSFGAVAQEWSEAKLHRLSQGTEKKYVSVRDNFLIKEFGERKIRSITTDQIAHYLANLKTLTGKPMSGSYAASIYAVLYLIMDFAANDRRGYLAKNPCDSLEEGERPKTKRPDRRAFTSDEAQAIISGAPGWLKPPLLTGLYAGLRPSEIVGLRWDDIDFEHDLIHVRYQLSPTHKYVQTKGKEHRDVDLLPNLRAVLFALPTRFSGGFVFPDEFGKMLTYNHTRLAFNKVRNEAQLDPELSLHTCRHTFASALLRDGKDVTWVSKMLGHRSPEITLNTYAHVIQRESRNTEAAERLREALGDLG